ncbi:MAG: FtsW/RodA/SpoVE family cell cycle protein [Lachnospiraceae bacterium]
MKQYQYKNLNHMILFLVPLLVALGSIFVITASPSLMMKQILGATLCLAMMAVVALIDYQIFINFSRFLYIINVILLVLVKLIGIEVKGATRWFSIGPLGTFQPSELTKMILIIFIAAYIEKYEDAVTNPKRLLRLIGLVLLPVFLIMIQTDLSTSLDILMIAFVIIFAGGLSYRYIAYLLAVAIPAFVGLVWYIQQPYQKLLKEYQLDRILSFINPSKYSSTEAYQQNNSIMAIGSGKLYGKGLYSKTITTVKDSNLVSEQQTDFIFSIIGEMVGFIGSIIIIAILCLLVVQCIRIAGKAKDTGGRLIAIGVAGYIGIQSFINIGVATAILPNTGLPLPFVSYGLSSLVSSCLGMGIVLNISLQKRRY